jgi:hypothetical protein
MKIQDYIRLAIVRNQTVNVGSMFFPIGGCGCLTAVFPPMGNLPVGPVQVFCDKHELGQLLADERARLEKAWGQLRP